MSNPRDLGAKMEMCMGPEMESHIVTQSTMIWIPAKFIHAPFRILEVTRPFLFIQCQYAPKLTETGLKKLVKEDMQDKRLFIDADGKQQDFQFAVGWSSKGNTAHWMCCLKETSLATIPTTQRRFSKGHWVFESR